MTHVNMLRDAETRLPTSFRDPAGFVIQHNGRILRFLKQAAVPDFEAFLKSKAGQALINAGIIAGSRALDQGEISALEGDAQLRALIHDVEPAMIIEHERIPFQSFAYEWCPQMLYEAAAVTLKIALDLLPEGIGVKDGTPYNVLYRGPNPVFIDLLSFEQRDRHDPVWLPYAQFARTFLLPLLVYKHFGIKPNEVFTTRRDGLEQDEVYRWTGLLQRLRPPFLSLVTMPTWLATKRNPDDQSLYVKKQLRNAEQAQFVVESTLKGLRRTLKKLAPPVNATSSWSDYTVSNNNYSSGQAGVKAKFVDDALSEFRPKRVLDIGCNTGQFSRMAAKSGASVVAIDYDPVVVDDVWRKSKGENLDILPLVVNLSRPTPATGWRNQECSSFLDRARGHFDCLLMLAVIHHMLVTDRVPLPEIIDVAAELTRDLVVIEFVAPADSMFKRISRGRDHLHTDLTEELFESTCARHFDIVRKAHTEGSHRTLYVLRKK
jgi:2-polyprenyl-3-methyl-5-hydroxy-6-metoxy-1,4-benzoquinol methylase